MLPMTEIDGVPHKSDIRAGMAFFSNTGPPATFCGGCVHRGYHRQNERFNPDTGGYVTRTHSVTSCALFKQMTGRHGPAVDAKWASCKYFEPKPKK